MEILRTFRNEEDGKRALADMIAMFKLKAKLEFKDGIWILFQEKHDQTSRLKAKKEWILRCIPLGKQINTSRKTREMLKNSVIVGDVIELTNGCMVWIL